MGEIATVTKLAGFEFTKYVSYSDVGRVLAIRGLNIKNGDFNLHDVKYIDNSNFTKLTRSKLKHGDILFTYVGTIGNSAIVPENVNWYLAPNVCLIRTINNVSGFIGQLIRSNKFQNHEIPKWITTSSQPSLSMKNIRKFLVTLPSNNEQFRIDKFLSLIDTLFSLQQRKLEQLKQLKKAMLQKISNHKLMVDDKEYENMKVKVADIYTVTRGNVLAKGKISPQKSNKYLYPVYSSQTKNDGLMGYYEKYLFENAITWTTDGANAGTVKYREGKFYSTNVNGVLLSNKGYANKLAASLLNQVAFKYVSHVGNPKLMNNVMKEITFQIPKNVKVQIKLSKYLALLEKSIDNQLVIENEYKKLRKFLLQKLFI